MNAIICHWKEQQLPENSKHERDRETYDIVEIAKTIEI